MQDTTEAKEAPRSRVVDPLPRLSPVQRSFVLFLLTSGTSVVVNLVLRYLLSRVVFFEAAVMLAYIGSTLVAFFLARTFVFAGESWKSELGRFALVNVVGMIQVVLVGMLLLRVVFPMVGVHWHEEELAHFLALASLSFTSFHLHRRFSFRNGLLPAAEDSRRKG